MSVREYIGARYVPLFMGEWDDTKTYEPLSIVSNEGNSYTSRQFVPIGIELTNETYWAETGNYNAQIESYRQEVLNLSNKVDSYLTTDFSYEIICEFDNSINSFYLMFKAPKNALKDILVQNYDFNYNDRTPYEIIKAQTNNKKEIYSSGILPGPIVANGIVKANSTTETEEWNYFIGFNENDEFVYTEDELHALTGNDLLQLGYKLAFPIYSPILINNSVFDFSSISEDYATQFQPRMIFGYDDNYIYIICVSGRSRKSKGLAMNDAPTFCRALGLRNAYNMDGGYSNQIWTTNPIRNLVYETHNIYTSGYSTRRLPGFLIFKED